MIDRIDRLTVILARDIREDDVESLVDAIRMLRGVLDVKTHVSDNVMNEIVVRSLLAREFEDLVFEWIKKVRG